MLIALEVDGRVVVGLCDAPARDHRHWAVRDRGAFWSRARGLVERLRVSATAKPRARSFVPPAEWRRYGVKRSREPANVTQSSVADHPACRSFRTESISRVPRAGRIYVAASDVVRRKLFNWRAVDEPSSPENVVRIQMRQDPGKPQSESWPHPIFQLALLDFELVGDAAAQSCD